MDKIIIQSSKEKEIIDITDDINNFLEKIEKKEGICYLFLLHTTAAITTGDMDPCAELDYIDAFFEITPKAKFRHPHNPKHFSDHFLSSLIGTSLLLPFQDGKLILGTWQRVIFIEFNGPRRREVLIKII